jgi:hypothetical protein
MTDYSILAETPNFMVLDRYDRSGMLKEEYQSEDALELAFIGVIFRIQEDRVEMKTTCRHLPNTGRAPLGALSRG